MLPRVHLFEFMDLESFPASMRRRLTDCLRDVEAFTGLFNWAVPLVVRLLRGSGRRTIVDLGTGSGGPIVRLFPALVQAGALDELCLTDLYPHPEAIAPQSGLRYDTRSVDASAVPRDLHGLRVLCNSFHHMPPEQAQAVLADAHAAGEPLLVLEALNRDPFAMVAAVSVAVMAWVVVPFLRRFDVASALLWWLVPVIPVLLIWEGVVSCLRCYTRRELAQMVSKLPGASHDTGVVQTGFIGARIRWFYLHARTPTAGA